MHIVLIVIGALIGLFGLYSFVAKANVSQIKALFITVALAAVFVAMFFLAVTGRLPAALGILAALAPIALSVWHRNRKAQQIRNEDGKHAPQHPFNLSREEALEILGVKDGASDKDIKDAHKRLIKKLHPDQEGSAWLAAKINAARDFLLTKK